LKVRKTRSENAGRRCHSCGVHAAYPLRFCECGERLKKGTSRCWPCHVKHRRVQP
jgi:hypothetical protein